MKFFFKRKFFDTGNSKAVRVPIEIYNIFMKGHTNNDVKITIEDNKIIIERYEE